MGRVTSDVRTERFPAISLRLCCGRKIRRVSPLVRNAVAANVRIGLPAVAAVPALHAALEHGRHQISPEQTTEVLVQKLQKPSASPPQKNHLADLPAEGC